MDDDDFYSTTCKALYIGETISSSLCSNPHQLQRFILEQAVLPPQIHVSIKGTHPKKKRSKKDNPRDLDDSSSWNGRNFSSVFRKQHHRPSGSSVIDHQYEQSSKQAYPTEEDDSPEIITDFSFSLDLTRYLLRRRQEERDPKNSDVHAWHELHVNGERVQEDVATGDYSNEMMAYDDEIEEDLNLLHPEEASNNSKRFHHHNVSRNLGLFGWCERFCRDPSPVKSYVSLSHLITEEEEEEDETGLIHDHGYRFRMSHAVRGFNIDTLRSELKDIIRSLNYRGDINIRISIHNNRVTVYSSHWINQLRRNPFIYWSCIISQLWLITWPVIYMLERRYHVVQSVWWSSRDIDEEDQQDTAFHRSSNSSSRLQAGRSGTTTLYAGGRSEEEVARLWAPVVMEAAWEQRIDGLLTDGSIRRLQQRRERLKQMTFLEPETVQLPRSQSHGRSRAHGPLVLDIRVRDFGAGWGFDS